MFKTHKLLWIVALLAALTLTACEAGINPTAEPPEATATEVVQPTIEPTTAPATAEPTTPPPTAEPTTSPPTAEPTTPPPTVEPTAANGQAATPAPTRVEFEPGATAALLTGELAARETDQYSLRVSAGQIMEVVISPEGGVQLAIYGADGTVLRSGMGEFPHFRGAVPSTQDYIIQLSAGEQAVTYTANVIIPARITFDPGATSAVASGQLEPHTSHHYVAQAQAGQFMTVNVTPPGSVRLSIYGVDGTVLRSGMGEGSSFEGQLPSTQDYVLAISSGDQPVSYQLELAIE